MFLLLLKSNSNKLKINWKISCNNIKQFFRQDFTTIHRHMTSPYHILWIKSNKSIILKENITISLYGTIILPKLMGKSPSFSNKSFILTVLRSFRDISHNLHALYLMIESSMLSWPENLIKKLELDFMLEELMMQVMWLILPRLSK